jgi:hypothetical protein
MFIGQRACDEKDEVCTVSVLETVNGSDPLPFVGYEGGQVDNTPA